MFMISFGLLMTVLSSDVQCTKQMINPNLFESPSIVPVWVAEVNLPNSGSIWEAGQNSVQIEWTLSGADEVKIDLFSGDSFIQELSSFSDNDGKFLADKLSDNLLENDNYRIRITGSNDSTAWSDYFTIQQLTLSIDYQNRQGQLPLLLSWETIAEPIQVKVFSEVREGMTLIYGADDQHGSMLLNHDMLSTNEGVLTIRIEDALGVQLTSAPVRVGYNDTPESAEEIEIGSVEADLYDDRDIDTYRVLLSSGVKYVFELTSIDFGKEQTLSLISEATGATLFYLDRPGQQSLMCYNDGEYILTVAGESSRYKVEVSESQKILSDWGAITFGPSVSFPTEEISDALIPSVGVAMYFHLFDIVELGLDARVQRTQDGILPGGRTHYSEASFKLGIGTSIKNRIGGRIGFGTLPTAPTLNYAAEEFRERLNGGVLFYASAFVNLSEFDETGAISIRLDYLTSHDKRSLFQIGVMLGFE